MPEQTSEPMAFDNGLTRIEDDEIDEIDIAMQRLVARIEALGRHRSYSLAITNLEQAFHWLRDRKKKPKNS